MTGRCDAASTSRTARDSSPNCARSMSGRPNRAPTTKKPSTWTARKPACSISLAVRPSWADGERTSSPTSRSLRRVCRLMPPVLSSCHERSWLARTCGSFTVPADADTTRCVRPGKARRPQRLNSSFEAGSSSRPGSLKASVQQDRDMWQLPRRLPRHIRSITLRSRHAAASKASPKHDAVVIHHFDGCIPHHGPVRRRRRSLCLEIDAQMDPSVGCHHHPGRMCGLQQCARAKRVRLVRPILVELRRCWPGRSGVVPVYLQVRRTR